MATYFFETLPSGLMVEPGEGFRGAQFEVVYHDELPPGAGDDTIYGGAEPRRPWPDEQPWKRRRR